MAVEKLEFIERRLGVSGKLLIAPVFILLLFALVTFYSIREFQSLDARMDTVARDLAPETAVATGVLINLYTMRLRVFDYYATGNEDILARFEQLETDFFRSCRQRNRRSKVPTVCNWLQRSKRRLCSTRMSSKANWCPPSSK